MTPLKEWLRLGRKADEAHQRLGSALDDLKAATKAGDVLMAHGDGLYDNAIFSEVLKRLKGIEPRIKAQRRYFIGQLRNAARSEGFGVCRCLVLLKKEPCWWCQGKKRGCSRCDGTGREAVDKHAERRLRG
jgi:hypothetical protein